MLENAVSISNDGECNIQYSKFKVIESFKGSLQKGDIFNATGISAHEYTEENSEHLLFLKPFEAYRSYGKCINKDYSEFLSIHNWCCSINNDGKKSFVMYDMIMSEFRSKIYLVTVADTFREMRKFKKRSNKAM